MVAAELGRLFNVGSTVAQDVGRHAKSAPCKTGILAVPPHLEVGPRGEKVETPGGAKLGEPNEAAVLPLPPCEGRPERPCACGVLRSNDLRQAVGVDPW